MINLNTLDFYKSQFKNITKYFKDELSRRVDNMYRLTIKIKFIDVDSNRYKEVITLEFPNGDRLIHYENIVYKWVESSWEKNYALTFKVCEEMNEKIVNTYEIIKKVKKYEIERFGTSTISF